MSYNPEVSVELRTMRRKPLLGLGMTILLLAGAAMAHRRLDDSSHAELMGLPTPPATPVLDSAQPPEVLRQPPGRAPLPWLLVENRGQLDRTARFASLFGAPLWLTDEGLRLRVTAEVPAPYLDDRRRKPAAAIGTHAFLTFEGIQAAVPYGIERAATEANYFRGNDPEHWVTRVPTWSRVRYSDLYPGIDLEIHGARGCPEYDLVLGPSADLGAVVVRVDGARELNLDADGSLRIDTAAGPVRQRIPATWELLPDGTRRDVPCSFRLIDEQRYGFIAPSRDHSLSMVVDPGLAWATLVGGDLPETAYDCAVDPTGSLVFCGQAPTTFPVTPGAYDTSANPNSEAFVAKLNPEGSALSFATFLGGSGFDELAFSVDLAADGSVVTLGGVLSADFPTTQGTFDPTYNGEGDMFVASLSSDGANLLWSTFLGGSGIDGFCRMKLDSDDRPCLVGGTHSRDFPLSPNAFDTSHNGLDDEKFVARLSANGNILEFSSFFGNFGAVEGICVAPNDRVFASGQTGSLSVLPVTPSAFDQTSNGFIDAYVMGFDLDAGLITACTWLGGGFNDHYTSLAVNPAGEIVVAGRTESSNFPVSSGGFQPFKSGDYDAFVVALPQDLSTVLYGSFVGGGWVESDPSLAIDGSGRLYIAAETGSTSLLPVTPDAFDAQLGGNLDGLLVRLSPDASKLLYGTLIGGSTGGSALEWQHTLVVTPEGTAFLVGRTSSDNFPATPGAFDTVKDGFSDLYVAKFDFSPWGELGPGVAGTGGLVPQLAGGGTLQPGSPGALSLTDAAPLTTAWLIVGVQPLNAPFKGGLLVPFPLLALGLTTNAGGQLTLPWAAWPAGLPAGSKLYFQAWLPDPAGPAGWSASNGLLALTPVPSLP